MPAVGTRLTPREVLALRLMFKGLSNKGIGDVMGIDPVSVKRNLERAARRLSLPRGPCRNVIVPFLIHACFDERAGLDYAERWALDTVKKIAKESLCFDERVVLQER